VTDFLGKEIDGLWRLSVTNRPRRLIGCERAAAAVEFGLTLPLALLIIYGVIEFGRLSYAQAALSFAVQETTRFAIVQQGSVTSTALTDYAKSQAIGLDPDKLTFSPNIQVTGIGDRVIAVRGDYVFSFICPFLPEDAINLSSVSRGFVAF
jgi:Flp pilus assembly protein TadG